MRRGLAGLILGLSLVIASVSWAGFVLTRTVLDPNRSERLADQLLDNEQLRGALVGRLSDALGAALPADVPIPRQQLEQAADAALEDERVQQLIRDGIVRTHQNALEGNAEPITIDASALGAASRDSLVAIRPELDIILPTAPAVEVALPTSGLSWLGSLRRAVTRFTSVLALVAAAGALLSLLITSDRPGVLRRVSFWAFGTAVFWMVVGFGIPFLARTLAPSSSAIIAAIVDVFFGAMIPPAIMMAVVGAALLGGSILWSAASDRRPAAILQPKPTTNVGVQRATGATAPTATTGGQVSNLRHSGHGPPPARSPSAQGGSSRVAPVTQATPVVDSALYPQSGASAMADATTIMPTQISSSRDQLPSEEEIWSITGSPPEVGRNQRWVEGVGYVDDEDSAT